MELHKFNQNHWIDSNKFTNNVKTAFIHILVQRGILLPTLVPHPPVFQLVYMCRLPNAKENEIDKRKRKLSNNSIMLLIFFSKINVCHE